MTKSTLGRLAGALVVLAGLYGSGTMLGAAPKPNTVSPVPLVVTVEDLPVDPDGDPIGISSDGLGDYENGIEGVTANFDAYGNLIINFNATQTQIVRKLGFNYKNPVAPGNDFRPPDALNSYLSTQTHPGGPIQNMPIYPTLGHAQCIQSNITFTDTDANRTMYRTHYRRALGSHDISGTSYLVVTRTDVNTWELEPKASACNTTNETVAKLFSSPTKGRATTTDRGEYYLPFKMTLVRQQP